MAPGGSNKRSRDRPPTRSGRRGVSNASDAPASEAASEAAASKSSAKPKRQKKEPEATSPLGSAAVAAWLASLGEDQRAEYEDTVRGMFAEFWNFTPTPESAEFWADLWKNEDGGGDKNPANREKADTLLGVVADLSAILSSPSSIASSSNAPAQAAAKAAALSVGMGFRSSEDLESASSPRIISPMLWGYRLFLWTHCLQRLLAELKLQQIAFSASASEKSTRKQQKALASTASKKDGGQLKDPPPSVEEAKKMPASAAASSSIGDASAPSAQRASYALTRLAFQLSRFVTQHQNRNGGAGDGGLLSTAGATPAGRSVAARAGLVALVAAVRGLGLLLPSNGALKGSATSSRRDRNDEEGGAAFLGSWIAGTVALESLVFWGEPPQDLLEASVGGNDGKAGTLPDEGQEEQKNWSVIRGALEQWMMNQEHNCQNAGGEEDEDVPIFLVESLEWSREIELWKALREYPGGPARSDSGKSHNQNETVARTQLSRSAPTASRSTFKKKAPAKSRGRRATEPSGTEEVTSTQIAGPLASASIFEGLQALVLGHEANRWSVDGRIQHKKWAPIALQWHLAGPSSLLHMCLDLLARSGNGHADGSVDTEDEEGGSEADYQLNRQLPPSVSSSSKVRVMLARRLLRTLSGMALIVGGSRASSGGIDMYVKLLGDSVCGTGSTGSGSSSTAASSNKKKAKKTTGTTTTMGSASGSVDLPSLAMAVAYRLVSAAASRSTTLSTHSETPCSSEGVVISLAQAVKDLARSIPGGTEADVDRIECAAAAFAFGLRCFGDARFSMFCVQKLAENVKRHGDDIVPERLLSHSLPRPDVNYAVSRSGRSKSSSRSEFGKVYEEGSNTLTVFLSALCPRSYDGLLSCLVDMAEACYNIGDSKPEPQTQKGKPKRKKPKWEAQTRPRYVAFTLSSLFDSFVAAENLTSYNFILLATLRIMGAAHLELAKEAFQALDLCLQMQKKESPTSSTCSSSSGNTIRAALRAHLSDNHLSRLISLGLTAQEFLMRVRSSASDSEPRPGVSPFSPSERQLWDSYINLCTCIARGHSTYVLEKRVVLGDRRYELFRMVIAHAMKDGRLGIWPLWLCSPHRSLLAASLAGESLENSSADHYLVNGLIDALPGTFANLKKTLDNTPTDPVSVSFEEGIPLSLNHARLFCLATLRLETSSRVQSLSALIDALHAGLASLGDSGLNAISDNEACARFIGRAVAMCTSLTVSATCDNSLPSRLYTIVGVSSPTYTPDNILERIELSFTSIFDGTTTPELEGTDFHESTLPKEKGDRLQELLHRSFSLGFRTSQIDSCYLLFVAWGAIGKSELWRCDGATSISPFSNLPEDLTILVLELREDICYVTRLVDHFNRRTYDSSFLRVVDRRVSGPGMVAKKVLSAKVFEALRSMMDKAEALCDVLLERYAAGGSNVPSEAFCLFEALPYYLSFVVACYTRVDRNFADFVLHAMKEQRSRKRRRSYSSDSDNCSEDDYVDSHDVGVDVADRLVSVCSLFGAVPAHPDWLDSDCHLFDNLTLVDAISASLRCMQVLGKIAAFASDQDLQMKRNSVHPGDPDLTSNLLRVCFIGSSTDTVPSFLPHLITLTGVDGRILDVGMSAAHIDCRTKIRRHWLRESSQRCLGSLQKIIRTNLINDPDDCLLRAGHEWEILLSGVLTSCALAPPPLSADDFDGAAYVAGSRWNYVTLAATNALIPCSALLYFSSSNTGRIFHPLKSVDFVLDDYNPNTLAEFSRAKPLPEMARAIVARTLGIVSQVHNALGDLGCEAIALNLSGSVELRLLRSVTAARFAFSALKDLLARSATQASKTEALRSLFKVISFVLKPEAGDWGSGGGVRRLRMAIGVDDQIFPTILGSELGVREILMSWVPEGLNVEPSDLALKSLLECIWPDALSIDSEARHSFLQALCSLTILEKIGDLTAIDSVIMSRVAEALNCSPESRLRQLIECDICGIHQNQESTAASDTACQSLSYILANSLAVRSVTALSRTQLMFGIIDQHLDKWMTRNVSTRSSVLNLYLLLAAYCNCLHLVGAKFFEGNQGYTLYNLASFASFVDGLRRCSVDDGNRCTSTSASSDVLLKNRCTHVIQPGFVNQHWYHCVTCNLTGDKGCCTLCALVCHAGHEVSYSRCSAFFCDCGAEGQTESPRGSFICRCLEEIPQDVVDSALAVGLEKSSTNAFSQHLGLTTGPDLTVGQCVHVAKLGFPEKVDKSLLSLVERGRKEDWFSKILSAVKAEAPAPLTTALPQEGSTDMPTYEYFRTTLSGRVPCVPVTVACDEGSLSRQLVFETSAFQVEISSESSVENLKRALLCTGGACRYAVSSSSRGLLAIAETRSMVLCSIVPELSQSGPHSSTRSLRRERASAYVVSIKKLDFDVIGLRQCPVNEDRLVVWGAHEVCLTILNESLTRVESTMNIDVGSIESNSDVVVDCGWLPSSATLLYVCCARSIMIFELQSGAVVTRASKLMTGTDSAFRGFVASEPNSRTKSLWKCHVLSDDGHLFAFELESRTGSVHVRNLNLDPKQSLKIPVNSPGQSTPAFSLTLGEGIQLSYLRQSRILLYQAVGESLLALPLDDDSSISMSFTLLPKTLESGVSGPFQHFTELGLVSIGSSVYFRVCCIGRRSSKDPVLVCIDFNHSATKVKELSLFHNSYCSGSMPTVEGVTAFSCPFSVVQSDSSFVERCFIVVLFSNGSLQVFGDDFGAPTIASELSNLEGEVMHLDDFGVAGDSHDVPLLAFERLLNVTDSDEVVIESTDLGSSFNLHKNLLRDNNESIVAPGSSGFRLTVRLKQRLGCHGFRALVAFRFLVGSTSSTSIPKRVLLQGRDLRLVPGVSKWYVVFLSQQEIAQAFRNGFVSIRVSEAFDGSKSSILDALECYACGYSSLSSWMPRALQSVVSSTTKQESYPSHAGDTGLKKCLSSNINALSSVASLLRPLKTLSSSDADVFRQLVSDAAVAFSDELFLSIGSVLEALGWEDETRDLLRDRAVLDGCSAFLHSCQEKLKSPHLLRNWQRYHLPLESCLKAASKVVATRPLNYLTRYGTGLTVGAKASQVLVGCFEKSDASLRVMPYLVELCLLEMVAGATSSFDGLRRILESEHDIVVALGCASIARFCARYETAPKQDSETDPFPRQMVVSYRCDACDLCPIEGTRYTYHRRGVDLCVSCYNNADQYASLKQYSEADDVRIAEKTVGGLKCSEMKFIQPVAAIGEMLQRQQLFDEFLAELFSHIFDVAVNIDFSNQALVGLALLICRQSAGAERTSRLAKGLLQSMSRTFADEANQGQERKVFGMLRALAKLVVWDDGASYCLSGVEKGVQASNLTSVEAPKCSGHKLAASYRKALRSPNGGRNFYCCSRDAKSQCKFFCWEDDPADSRPHFNEVAARIVWDEMQAVQEELSNWISTKVCPPSDAIAMDANEYAVQQNSVAGVMCSRDRLRDVAPEDLLSLRSSAVPSLPASGNVVSALLQVLSLIASPKGNSVGIWSSFLCQTITAGTGSFKEEWSDMAKRALLQLCNSKSRYSAVRAHFAFAWSGDRLINEVGVLIHAALAVKEKARQCGSNWKKDKVQDVAALRAGDLLGTEDLISEDIMTPRLIDEARQILSELIGVVKKRPDHWARFCGIVTSVPDSLRLTRPATQQQLLKVRPGVLLFIVACLVRGDAQVKAFRLIDLALSSAISTKKRKGSALEEDAEAAANESMKDEIFESWQNPAPVFELSRPEAVAFVIRYGCGGSTCDVRQLACSIVSKLFLLQGSQVQGDLFESLAAVALSRLVSSGKCSLELLRLLKDLLATAGRDHIRVSNIASSILSSWKLQMRALRSTVFNGARRYDLAACANCMNTVMVKRSDKRTTATTNTAASDIASTIGMVAQQANTGEATGRGSAVAKGWLPDQVTVFSRGRLEGWRDATISDDFNMYSSLKYRLVLSEFHLEVSDPRGRYAKTISFYYSPRPVVEVSELKSPGYSEKWQLCGSITLEKGASRGSYKLLRPVAAANIRVEFSSFYERPGSSKSSDGGFVIHCPRCSRVVTNAHGVCGNCGEVCFQCRKCRHINYDRLDAFLCAECGYCASGSFVFELTAAIASNAICVLNDLDYERSCRMLAIASRLHEDLQCELRDRIDDMLKDVSKDKSVDPIIIPWTVSRVFSGGLPVAPDEMEESNAPSTITLSKLGKPGSVVKAVARSDRTSISNAALSSLSTSITSRSQSLLRLTREWRESASRGRVSGTSDSSMLIQHLGRVAGGGGGSRSDHHNPIMMDEDESSELFGLLEGAAAAAAAVSAGRAGGSSSGDDPLSRLLATMQSRRERRAAAATSTSNDVSASAAAISGTGAASGSSAIATGSGETRQTDSQLPPTASKEAMDLCDRLYALMREAERESYLLRLRVSAWRRLGQDALLMNDSAEPVSAVVQAAQDLSSVCSSCAAHVALHLLKLWLELFRLRPDQIVVTPDAVQLLCTEDVVEVGNTGTTSSYSHNKSSSCALPLAEARRSALQEIALHGTPHASGLVLDALRLRLLASSRNSAWCSEVLGSIIEAGGPREFRDLAMEVLDVTADL